MARARWVPPIAAVGILAVWLTACNGYKKADTANFTGAINGYYTQYSDCLFSSPIRFPYEVDTHQDSADMTRSLDALTTAGLLKRIEEPAIHVKRYSLTPYASKTVNARFCYGHREVTSIVSFTPPAPVNGEQSSQVTYRYKMTDVPGWAQSDEMRTKFPALAKNTSGQAQATTRVVLTPSGWRVPE